MSSNTVVALNVNAKIVQRSHMYKHTVFMYTDDITAAEL